MDHHASTGPDPGAAAALRAILQVIRRSRDDEAPVFEAILDSARRLCDAPMAGLILARPGEASQRLAAHHGARPSTVALYRDGGVPLDPAQSYVARTILDNRLLHLPDMADSDLYRAGSPYVRSLVDEQGIRSILFVPLSEDSGAIGALTLFRHEVRPFGADQIALLEAFAAQAVIAIENVRQFRELQARLERETATKDILRVISQSRDSEEPVFDAILASASHLCGSDTAALLLLNDARTHNVVRRRFGTRLLSSEPAADSWAIDGGFPNTEAVRSGRPVHDSDLRTNPLYLGGNETMVYLVDVVGLRSLVAVPLLRDGTAIGALTLHRLNEARAFSDTDIALLEAFAAQAVIAIENVRQFRELRARLEREKASREILQVISQSRDDGQPVFQTILRNAARLCNAGCAYLDLVDDAGTQVELVAQWGETARMLDLFGSDPMPLDAPHTPTTAIRGRRVVRIDDMADTDLYRDGDPKRRRAVDAVGIRACLCVPLIHETRALGCITVYRREVRPFSADEVALVETFAAQAVIAIENVRQFKALETLNAELESRVAAQVGEIERMGRLRRFLPPAVADAVIGAGDERLLGSHRALIAVLFADIRGFTAFCETAEPEETIEVLQTYHEEMGTLIRAHGAGVDARAGDGIMVIMGDPLPCDDPAGDALRLALAMRDRMAGLARGWKRLGHRLGFGVGLSFGYATVGMVGAAGRYDYTASGTAVNLAARLCEIAGDGDILLSPRAWTAVEGSIAAESLGERNFKGIKDPVEVFRVLPPG